jgi:hypothetical protein
MTREHSNALLRADRAFVVQFESECGFERDRRDDARGRVEHVVSGRASRFRTLEELLVFLAAVLRETAPDAREAQ